jgi:hypothetical protein
LCAKSAALLLLQASILREAVPEDVQQAEAAGIVLMVRQARDCMLERHSMQLQVHAAASEAVAAASMDISSLQV